MDAGTNPSPTESAGTETKDASTGESTSGDSSQVTSYGSTSADTDTDSDCSPGAVVCVDDESFQVCGDDGFGSPIGCPDGTKCSVGICESVACADAALEGSHAGCEFWAADLPNVNPLSPGERALDIVVGNPHDVDSVEIKIFDGTDELLFAGMVAPGEASPITLTGPGGYFPDGLAVGGTGLAKAIAFRLTASHPVTAIQSNRFENDGVYSSDVSLLLPAHRLGTRHTTLSWGPGSHEGGTRIVRGHCRHAGLHDG